MKGKFIRLTEKKRKIFLVVVVLVAVAALAGGIAFFTLHKKGNGGNPFGGQGMGQPGNALSGNVVGVSGVISVGVTEETFDVENLTTELEIEEVYISSEEEISAGDKVLKLDEESVAEAREELEATLREAELAYRAGAIEYEQNKITAEYDYQTALLEGEQAEEVYNETVASLKDALEEAQEALEDAQEDIAEYESYVNDDSYKTYFKVDEYKALYEENYNLLVEKMDEWGVSWEQVTGGGGFGGSDYSYAGILRSLYSVLEQNGKDLEEAESEYEDAVLNASFELQTLQLKLPSLEQAVTEAQENYEVQAGEAKLTYEKALASAERAESDYETQLEKIESDYKTLESTYEDAKENLELFESSVGDGYFYASGSGTILRTMVRAEQNLTQDAVIFMYSNPEEMTVTVSVDQSDIASLNVGDDANVMDGTGNNYEGSITQINPVTASDSRTNVTYSVTVQLAGEVSALSANDSVTVVFGMTAKE